MGLTAMSCAERERKLEKTKAKNRLRARGKDRFIFFELGRLNSGVEINSGIDRTARWNSSTLPETRPWAMDITAGSCTEKDKDRHRDTDTDSARDTDTDKDRARDRESKTARWNSSTFPETRPWVMELPPRLRPRAIPVATRFHTCEFRPGHDFEFRSNFLSWDQIARKQTFISTPENTRNFQHNKST